MNFITIALLYLGTVMGAGFASGRECWQYFGVFGNRGYLGLIIETALFVGIGLMTAFLARRLNTADLSKILLPSGHERTEKLFGLAVGVLIYCGTISMTAAGGSLLYQRFGLPKAVGGFFIALLVIITVIGGFERVAGVFKIIMPFLFIIVVGLAIYVGITFDAVPYADVEPDVSSLAPVWPLGAVVYVTYNIMGTIPINSQSALSAAGPGHAYAGVAAGGLLLATIGFVLLRALLKDPELSQSLDLPMLGLAGKISPMAGRVFFLVLFFAIYSAATSCFYGFSTRFGEKKQNSKIIFFSLLAFFLGMLGFKNMVKYIYPAMGYFGLLIIILMTVRTVHELKRAAENK